MYKYDQEFHEIWIPLFETLSFESVAPLWGQLGLNLLPSKTVITIAQDFLRELFFNDNNLLLEKTLRRISSDIDPKAVQIITEWGEQIRQQRALGSTLSSWYGVLVRLSKGKIQGSTLIHLNLPTDRVLFLTRQVKQLDIDIRGTRQTIENLEASLQEVRKTEVLMLTGEPKPLPLTTAIYLMQYHVYLAFWATIRKELTSAQLDVLEVWGKKQAQIMGLGSVSLAFLHDLARLKGQ